jgi:hypothetical protein
MYGLSNAYPDTIARTRKLDYTLTQPPGDYTLVLAITDRLNGVSSHNKTNINISSEFGTGYYILKAEGGQTDLDFIDRNGALVADVLYTYTGERIAGQPINTGYLGAGMGLKFDMEGPDGTVVQSAALPTFVICTDQDVRIYNGDDFSLLRKWEDIFMEAPAVRKPMGIVCAALGGVVLNNDNQIYLMRMLGKFGYAWPGDYRIRYLVSGTTGFLAHDDTGGAFLAYPGSGISVNKPIVDDKYAEYDLIFFGAEPYAQYMTYNQNAVLRHKTTGQTLVVKIAGSSSMSSIISFSTEYSVPAETAMLNASVFAQSGGNGSTVIFYSGGDNRVSYYNFGNQITKKDMIVLPEGEKVVYLKNAFNNGSVNELLILTEKDGGWKLYVYDFEGFTPDVLLPARATYSGSGTPKTVMYRNASTYVTY